MEHRLNLGCGKDLRFGWINMDILDLKVHKIIPYIKHDLNKFPYPLPQSYYDNILMANILEHLREPTDCLKEVIRISRDQAIITVVVPHANSYASNTDIQHRTKFTENSFTDELLIEYELRELQLIAQYFHYNNRWKRFIPFKSFFKIFFNGVYDDIIFKLRVNKEAKHGTK